MSLGTTKQAIYFLIRYYIYNDPTTTTVEARVNVKYDNIIISWRGNACRASTYPCKRSTRSGR